MSEVVSIYARFDTEEDREDWFDFHILPETSPSGGPVFSWSDEDESGYRDLITELVGALEEAQYALRSADKTIMDRIGSTNDHRAETLTKIETALTKAKGSEK